MKTLILLLLIASSSLALICPCGSTNLWKMAVDEDAPYPPQGVDYYVCTNCGARNVDGYWCTAADYIETYIKASKERQNKFKKEKD